jgi:purine-nucleoside phosphorylase
VTDDVFYHPQPQRLAHWAAFGVLAVEMEASALFTVAARHGIQAGCIVMVSNAVNATAEEWLDSAERERAIDSMTDVALDAAVSLMV